MNRSSRGVAAVLAAGLATAALVAPAAPARAANCAEPGTAFAPVPWPQRFLDVERVWPLTRGGNVRVAVLDSGVDANHPQLRGRVVPGVNLVPASADLPAGGDGRADCAGRGTQTAGIIAAQPVNNVGFHGIAPDAVILPVRVSDNEANGPTAFTPGLAAGIRFAISNGARVILVSPTFYAPSPDLEAAVAQAVAADVLVVAAVGEDAGSNGLNRVPYPASLPGVLGVGAIDDKTLVTTNSGRRSVDLVAPGAAVVSTQRGSGLTLVEGTAYAAAYVAGAAALVRGRWPDLRAAEVIRRLTATAAPAPGGIDNGPYGSGIVNPYAALADQLTNVPPAALPDLPQDDASDLRRERNWTSSANLAMLLAGIGILVALALVGLGAAFPRGRRRRWRPSITRPPVQRHEDEEPQPPVRLFADRETS